MLRQSPLSSWYVPSRSTSRLVSLPGVFGAGKLCGASFLYRRAVSMKLFQISAGYVPPATGSPWNSVSIGRSVFG